MNIENILFIVFCLIFVGIVVKAWLRSETRSQVYWAMREDDVIKMKAIVAVYGHRMPADLHDTVEEWLKSPHEKKSFPQWKDKDDY